MKISKNVVRRVGVGGVALALTAGALGGIAPTAAGDIAVPVKNPIAPCTPGATEVWLKQGVGGGTAGATYISLEFANLGKNLCTMNGRPGVSAYDSHGHQVGPSASWTGKPTTVTLHPGDSARSIVKITDAGALCRPVSAKGLRVYAPNQSKSVQLPMSLQVCPGKVVLSASPVKADPQARGYIAS